MLLYETERSDRREYLYCQRDHNFNFPAHLHHSFEFLCVQAGTLVCTVETETYEVGPGQGLLILPDQIHSYRTKGPSESVLWVFSNDWVPEFSSQLGQRVLEKPVFSATSVTSSLFFMVLLLMRVPFALHCPTVRPVRRGTGQPAFCPRRSPDAPSPRSG